MKKILKLAILVGYFGILFVFQTQSQTNQPKLVEKITINLGADYFKSKNRKWFYLQKKQQILACEKGKCRIFDLETGKLVKKMPIKVRFNKYLGSLSPNEDKIIFYGEKKAQLWDISQGRLISILPKTWNTISKIVWSADGKSFIRPTWTLDGWFDKSLYNKKHRIYNSETGNVKRTIKTEFKSISYFSPTENIVVTSEYNKLIRKNNLIKFWDLESGKLIKDLQFDTYKKGGFSTSFNANGKYLLVSGVKGLKVIDVRTKKIKHISSSSHYIQSPSGKYIAVLKRGEIEVYSLETGRQISKFKASNPKEGSVVRLQMFWSQDEKSFVSVEVDYFSGEYTAKVWNVLNEKSKFILYQFSKYPLEKGVSRGTWLQRSTRLELYTRLQQYTRLRFSSNSKYLIAHISYLKGIKIYVWDAETGEFLKKIVAGNHSPLLTSDNRYLTKIDKQKFTISFYEIK